MKGAEGLSDSRFTHLKSDPKFGGLKRKERKVVVGDRFASALTDARFTRAPLVDKRGRKVKRTGDATLHRLYEIEKKGAKEEDEEEEVESEVNEDESIENEDNEHDHLKYDLARGDGEYVSSSSEEDDEEEDEDWKLEKADVDHNWGNLDKEVRRVEWASRRLAICNLDWDSLSSQDLFLLVSSFKPLGGHIESLSIYLSDMGKEKLEREEKEGPQLIMNENGKEDSDEEDDGGLDEETLKHHDKKREAIRRYQIERLKYFYAVLVCDSEQTASAVYETCDGVEYENSGLRLDLRFVPDDMTFDESRLKERVTTDDVDNGKYKPREISNMAAASTKVKLTWDESDLNRKKKMRGAFDVEADLDEVSRDLIAPSSGEDSGEEDHTFDMNDRMITKKERLAILLGGGDKDDGEMEVEWEKYDNDEKEEVTIKKKSKSSWEEYLEKRKAKRKEKKNVVKEERRKAREEKEKDEDEKRMEKKKVLKKEVMKEKDDRSVTVDARFNALFTHSAFSIDTSSNLNKSKGLADKQNAVRRKRKTDVETNFSAQEGHHSLVDKLKSKSMKWSS